VINQCREYDEMIADYEALTSDLLEWIKKTIETLNNREFPNSLAGVQNMLMQFNNYRTLEKPPKYDTAGYRILTRAQTLTLSEDTINYIFTCADKLTAV